MLYPALCRFSLFDGHFQSLVERIGMYMHAHTLYSAIRPFGVSLLLGSYEKDGPHLYVIEPSGLHFVSCCLVLVG